MLRGIFMPPGVSPDQVAYYIGLFSKVRAAGMEGIDGQGRVQAFQAEWARVLRPARQERATAPRADEGSRVHRELNMHRIPAPEPAA